MSRFTLTALSLAALSVSTLGTSLQAQTMNFYSPKFMESTEGQYYSYRFGSYADMRYQMVDGENRGTVGAIKEIALRLDNRNHTSSTAMGRSWTGVTVDMSNGDHATFSSNFSANAFTPTEAQTVAASKPGQTSRIGAPRKRVRSPASLRVSSKRAPASR